MSEATDADAPARGREVWIEKYRPQRLEDVVGHEAITERLESYIERDDLPHLLFAGPAGVGKCVTGETPVLTDRGIERIEDVVGDVNGFAPPEDGLEILTFDDGEFRYVEPSHVFNKRAEGLVSVRTRDGNEVTVTPEHRLLVLGHDGLGWKRAGELEGGERVVRPLGAPLPEDSGELDWVSGMDGDRTLVHVTEEFATEHGIPAEENHVGIKKQVVSGLRRGLDEERITAETGAPKGTVQKYRRQLSDVDFDEPSRICSLSYLRELDVPRDDLRRHVERIQYVTRYNSRSTPIVPPWEVTPDLATFLGLAVSEARLEGGRVKFYNTDERLLERFEATADAVFDETPSAGEQQGVQYRHIENRTLTHFLESCFDVFDGMSGGTGVGSVILRADDASRAAFLQAVFDAEAHVSDNGTLELAQKRGELITLLSYLLTGFGIPSRRRTERKAATNGSGDEQEYHVLCLSGAGALARFRDAVEFTVDRKVDRLAEHAAKDANPNHDTVPVQTAVDDLCEALYLPKTDLLTGSLNDETPGRRNYFADVERVLDAATRKLETAQIVLERLDGLSDQIDAVSAIPAVWIGERTDLGPIETRRTLAETTGIRSDRLLEYSDGRRTPSGARSGRLLAELGETEDAPDTERVRTELRRAIEQLGVPDNHVAAGTEMRGTDIGNLLRSDDHDLASLSRFATVAERIEEVATGMLSLDVFESLQTLDVLTRDELYFDEVERVERVDSERRVYDLTVPGTRNYVAGDVPTVMHNTTSAIAIAKEVYGDSWRENFLELNASDERGIDVVRDRIKSFARSSFGGFDYRIIFLDEADALTSDAQSALRRTMEQFSNNTRFILSCNYSSQIIDPIQSRCAVFRFSPLGDEAVEATVREIADAEGIEVTDDGVDALVYAAGGDMRKAINGLQAAAVLGGTVDEEAVYAITSTARPEEIREMVTSALDGEFTAARAKLDELLVDAGIAGDDIIDQLHRSVWEFGLDEREAVRVMERIGETDYRITAGANEQVQLEALLASLALEE